jgi:hypothetical protein
MSKEAMKPLRLVYGVALSLSMIVSRNRTHGSLVPLVGGIPYPEQ